MLGALALSRLITKTNSDAINRSPEERAWRRQLRLFGMWLGLVIGFSAAVVFAPYVIPVFAASFTFIAIFSISIAFIVSALAVPLFKALTRLENESLKNNSGQDKLASPEQKGPFMPQQLIQLLDVNVKNEVVQNMQTETNQYKYPVAAGKVISSDVKPISIPNFDKDQLENLLRHLEFIARVEKIAARQEEGFAGKAMHGLFGTNPSNEKREAALQAMRFLRDKNVEAAKVSAARVNVNIYNAGTKWSFDAAKDNGYVLPVSVRTGRPINMPMSRVLPARGRRAEMHHMAAARSRV